MTDSFLAQLLLQKESATLEFKRQIYDLDSSSLEGRKRSKNEMVKDILSLANNNVSSAGEMAYLLSVSLIAKLFKEPTQLQQRRTG